MDLSELREEFQEQVLVLRRKVLHRIKPKMLNGKKLTGPMMVNLAQNYVMSINDGFVPNIENAWNYICKNQCQKAVEEAFDVFKSFLREGTDEKLPLDDDELKIVIKEAKSEAFAVFNKKIVGGHQEEYMGELKNKIREVVTSLTEENERLCAEGGQRFLEEAYGFIERKLKNKEFTGGFAEYESDMKSFQHYFMENGPAGPFKRIMLLEFMYQASLEAGEFFNKSISGELEL